jgi:hypothetical protein
MVGAIVHYGVIGDMMMMQAAAGRRYDYDGFSVLSIVTL